MRRVGGVLEMLYSSSQCVCVRKSEMSVQLHDWAVAGDEQPMKVSDRVNEKGRAQSEAASVAGPSEHADGGCVIGVSQSFHAMEKYFIVVDM